MPTPRTKSTGHTPPLRRSRSVPRHSKKYLFAAIGGSGSTQLLRILRKRYRIGDKPDTVFRPAIPALRVGDGAPDQGRLRDRAPGFSEQAGESIDDFLLRYVRFLHRSPARTAIFNTCAELGLF